VTTVDALQTTLAGEHAALWLYGVCGGRASESLNSSLYTTLRAGYDVHRGQRDQLVRTLRDLGTTPVPAAVAYDLPSPLASAVDLQRAARDVEQRCAATYAALVAQSVGDQRRRAVTALTGAALRVLDLGGDPEDLPGIGSPGAG
jgi:Domain of unknown function (DUF4439)